MLNALHSCCWVIYHLAADRRGCQAERCLPFCGVLAGHSLRIHLPCSVLFEQQVLILRIGRENGGVYFVLFLVIVGIYFYRYKRQLIKLNLIFGTMLSIIADAEKQET